MSTTISQEEVIDALYTALDERFPCHTVSQSIDIPGYVNIVVKGAPEGSNVIIASVQEQILEDMGIDDNTEVTDSFIIGEKLEGTAVIINAQKLSDALST